MISLEGWTDIMYYVQDAHSFWNWIYFVLLIVVNSTIHMEWKMGKNNDVLKRTCSVISQMDLLAFHIHLFFLHILNN